MNDRRRVRGGEYLRLLRPKQWLKNAFLFAPLIFARELFNPLLLLEAVRAFVAFCLAASVVYIINDMTDRNADRRHPDKKSRPLASGTITLSQAAATAVILAAIVAALCLRMDHRFIAVIAAYVLLNVIYSWKLKEVVLLDVFVIAAGFMFRVLGGAYAINVNVSSWLVLCTLFISLFLGFAKRRSELIQSGVTGEASERKVLKLYSVGFLDQMLTIAAAGAVIAYALYTVAPRTVQMFGTERMIYTTVFVLFGVFRYLYLIHTTPATENPTNALTSDPMIVSTGILWILSCILLIYTAGGAR